MARFKVYTDGAASKNGQEGAVGGWAFAIIQCQDNGMPISMFADSGAQRGATNQQMELTAVIKACQKVTEMYPVPTHEFIIDPSYFICSDSAYVINCYKQGWWENWQRNGWKNAKKEPVANKELWQQLIPFFRSEKFTFVKVDGHSGDKYNDYVDELAVSARLELNG